MAGVLSEVWAWIRGPKGIRIRDVLIAAVICAFVPNETYVSPLGLLPAGTLSVWIAVLGSAFLLVRRQFPRTTVVVTVLTYVLVGVVFAAIFACYSVANQLGNRRSTWTLVGFAAVVTTVPWQPGLSLVPQGQGPVNLVLIGEALLAHAVTIGFPVLIGLWRAQHRELLASLSERASQAERERDLRAASAVAEERTRIARELHDVVAHRISLINVHSGAMTVAATGELAVFAENIRQASSTAMTEMRELMSVLRHGDAADSELVPLRPQPTLEAVRELVEQAQQDGQRVSTELPADLPELPGSTVRAVYWMVRESLVNTAKHAPGGQVLVTLLDLPEQIDVRVSNTAGVPEALRAAPAPRSGFGLLGMRERVLLSGGCLSVGPTPDGGFLVSASFPKEGT